MIIKTNLDRSKKYILACSFGPDSMALFDYLVKEKFDFVVAHVNYAILKQADDDEKGILDFAKRYGIKVYVLKTHMPENVNEEERARNVRYKYFGDLALKLGIKNILVAHNEDDLLETYFLQLRRNNVVAYYGLKEKVDRENYSVIRPLLAYTKSSLKRYCLDNEVPFSIDPSNEDTKFQRNEIRVNVVRDMDRAKRNALLEEIQQKNAQILTFLLENKKYYRYKSIRCDKEFFEKVDEKKFNYILIMYLKNQGFYTPLSRGATSEIYKAIQKKNGNRKYKLNDTYSFYFEYGYLSLKRAQTDYFYVVDSPDKSGLFVINSESKNYDLVSDKFPLVIKKVNPNERYKYDGKTYKVNRELISWKVPMSLREVWPGIYDKNLNLLYVPHYQKGKIDKNGLLKFNLKDIYQ